MGSDDHLRAAADLFVDDVLQLPPHLTAFNGSSGNPHANVEEEHKAKLEAIEYLTANAQEVQDRVLHTILQRNARTEYLDKHLGNNIMSSISSNGSNSMSSPPTKHVSSSHVDNVKASFKRLVPVVSYEDVEPYIQRIANGDRSPILSADPTTEFLTSSGTSGGERKLMPTIPEELERKKFLYSLLMPIINQYLRGLDEGKGLYFLFIKSETTTPGGLLARPVLTSYYKSRHFTSTTFDPFNVYTSPVDTILCLDSYQSMYCQMLCGLIEREHVLRMGAIFASGFLRAIKFLRSNWQELCNDIRTGSLSSKITHAPCRRAMGQILHSDVGLADLIQHECSKESWKGIIRSIWPNVRYIEAIVTGTMSQYISTLDHYSDELPLVCTMYASSECYFGVNLKPLQKPSDVSYTILPNMGYFEFIPLMDNQLEHDESSISLDDRVLDLTQLEVGKDYELVVTTYAGLYRYKVGDVLRVTGFHNSAPEFKFICRKNVILSIDADKTDEDCLHQAVLNASKFLNLKSSAILTEYTSFADAKAIPGHYVLFWELQNLTEPVDAPIMQECCLIIEDSLDSVYRQCRNYDSIGPLEIRLVKSGTFDKLMDNCVKNGSSINQFKMPRCIKSPSALDILDSHVMSNHFSYKPPFWAPTSSS